MVYGTKLLLCLLVIKRWKCEPLASRWITWVIMSIPKCTPGSFAYLEIRVCRSPEVWLAKDVPEAGVCRWWRASCGSSSICWYRQTWPLPFSHRLQVTSLWKSLMKKNHGIWEESKFTWISSPDILSARSAQISERNLQPGDTVAVLHLRSSMWRWYLTYPAQPCQP